MQPDGIGLRLSSAFFSNVIEPIMSEHFPRLPFAAARIGLGSEVLGFDTEMSADHDYGPSVQIFLTDADFSVEADAVLEVLDTELLDAFEGWPVRFPANTRPAVSVRRPGMAWSQHGVELYTVGAWCDRFLQRRFEAPLEWRDWLAYPEHFFLLVTAGRVLRDDLGELSVLRQRLNYFPCDVWLYKLAVQWGRIAEERAYVGRTGSVGDEIGSSIVAARMVENIMRVAFLVEQRYAPYPKWLGSAFSLLSSAKELTPIIEKVLVARGWRERERALYEACQYLARLQVRQHVPGAIDPTAASIHARPFQFVDSLSIGASLRGAIEDEVLRDLPDIGAADQFLSANFVRAVPELTQAALSALLDTKIVRSDQT